ncbi:tRNA (adenosine(37)-N6)-threonylcarbamoyltransferase complex dimerization subunit type 1 TsaB [Paenibacillus segetis]|uniref:tRNA (Adenosine(37)-N6)-threonylcarbamoyltransferase complex dimerization subunit type 1 TsaB n=1 Tax=Paenibacillus segetis TaxID=1325360 RepID=A0ABQ1Y5Y9_9BACL|nr:tRNA (adenosine(37)-N6)-threonylcarbamoyltransferase complex dimerization subunit type 1 TsaB [Paenibacillus segetis]GGH12753.1 tRNA (adenosine(37)-N6)-threonylcarbamoyltransferase complex dimerization subunit type 1 TsaB [Paenibacillus segetis]
MNNNEQGPRQRLLAFDTSTSSLAVAVMENDKLLAQVNILAERNHSAYLVTAIQECLDAAGLSRGDLDGIAVGLGPGSYTGIRIAVTTAKTLAWALNLPVVGFSSLEATAIGGFANGTEQNAANIKSLPAASRSGEGVILPYEHWIIPLVDARRGQVYTALFAAAEGSLPRRLEPDAIRLMDNWCQDIATRLISLAPENRPQAIWFVGETGQHEAAAEELRPLLGENLHIIPYELEGVWVGLCGADHFQMGERDDVHALEPNYTQLAEAEAVRLRKA